MQKKILLALIALTFAFAPATAERIKHEDKIIEAITLMDEGKYAPSIRILRDVLATDSTNYHARYELGYAYYLAGNYRQSATEYAPLVDYPEANDQTFSMLGNALDMAGDRKRALDAYYDGIKRFPNSGTDRRRQQDRYGVLSARCQGGARLHSRLLSHRHAAFQFRPSRTCFVLRRDVSCQRE